MGAFFARPLILSIKLDVLQPSQVLQYRNNDPMQSLGDMPDLSSWIADDSTWVHWTDILSLHGGNLCSPSEIEAVLREDLPELLRQVWHRCGGSTQRKWTSFLGVGLVYVASDGNLEAVEQLIAAGATLTARDRDGCTPLHRASLSGHADVVARLLDEELVRSPLDPSKTPRLLWQGSGDGPAQLVSASSVMKMGGRTINARDNSGCVPLHRGASSGNAQVVRLLLDHGADPTARNSLRETPLHHATQQDAATDGDNSGIALIVERGGDITARDNAGRTPLHAAAVVGTEASTQASGR